MAAVSGPLAGVRVLDLSRVLAGPVATQLMGDLGADVIKIERPAAGDDTRQWGPPWLPDESGASTGESAYFLSANRNKRSVTIDFAKPAGQELVRALAEALRRSGRELQGRRSRPVPPRLRQSESRVSAAGLLLDLRLRPDRSLCRARRVRLPGAGPGRRHEHHRRGGWAADEGRRRRRRRRSAASMRPLPYWRRSATAIAPARASTSTWACWTPRWPGWSIRASTI